MTLLELTGVLGREERARREAALRRGSVSDVSEEAEGEEVRTEWASGVGARFSTAQRHLGPSLFGVDGLGVEALMRLLWAVIMKMGCDRAEKEKYNVCEYNRNFKSKQSRSPNKS